jgi:hypothetical protein
MDDRTRLPDRPRASSTRKAKRLQMLGTGSPSCAVCGFHRNSTSLEVHHIAGEANQELSVILCRTCHDDLSDTAIDTLGDLRRRYANRDPLTVLGALLQGLADFLRPLGDSLEAWATWCLATGPHLSERLGPQWWKALPAAAPR